MPVHTDNPIDLIGELRKELTALKQQVRALQTSRPGGHEYFSVASIAPKERMVAIDNTLGAENAQFYANGSWHPMATSPAVFSSLFDLLGTSSGTISNGTIDRTNSYCYSCTAPLTVPGAPISAITMTFIWARIIYATYTGSGEPGVLDITDLLAGTAASASSITNKNATGEIIGYWGTGGLGTWNNFGMSAWSSVDGTINVGGSPTFAAGEILIDGFGLFPSF